MKRTMKRTMKLAIKRIFGFAGLLASLAMVAAAHASLTPHEILKAADEARGNVAGVSWQVSVQSTENNEVLDDMSYEIKARGFDVSGLSLAPPKSRGQKLLMLSSSMWFYKPGLSKPVPISQRQKLLGDAAYGDIASTNYAEDYEANQLPDETVDGDDCYVFDLKAKNDKTTYDRIKYWVSKKRLLGVMAEYYTVSGKKFKSSTMDYGNQIRVDGQVRPFISRITFHSTLMNSDITYLNLSNPQISALPDYVFDLNLFMR